ncbi:hypothetical protein CTI14_58315, partial [Methylobacterium radiotolerans]
LAPRIRRFTARPRPALAGALILGYLAAYAVMRGVLLVGGGMLSVAVAAGLVDVVSNRGSLLYNLFFFLGGAYLAPRIRRFTARPRPALAGALILGYLAAYAVMR